MPVNVIQFPLIRIAANDDNPTGPGGSSVSRRSLERYARIVRTLRGVDLSYSVTGSAKAA